MGVQFGRKTNWIWVYLTYTAAMASACLGAWMGPRGMYIASTAGLIFSFVGIICALVDKDIYAGIGYSVAAVFVHFLLILVGWGLYVFFLKPLPDPSLRLPSFSHHYVDPEGLFELTGPAGWEYVSIVSADESGVQLHPASREDYMGISEMEVMVRRLDVTPPSPSQFLKKMASSLSQRKASGKKMFLFTTEPAELLTGGEGLWSTLDIKKFWLPLRQVALFGVKNKRYFCAVSASGLKAHSTLARVVCMGVYEKMRVLEHFPLPNGGKPVKPQM